MIHTLKSETPAPMVRPMPVGLARRSRPTCPHRGEMRMASLRELTGQRRNRVFSYHAYLAILNEGGEPL